MNKHVIQITDNLFHLNVEFSSDFLTGRRTFHLEKEQFNQWLYINGLQADSANSLGPQETYIMRGSEKIGQYWLNEHEYNFSKKY